MPSIKKQVLNTLAVVLALGGTSASAQPTYPNKPIHLIVNGAPGSLPDLFSRPIAEKLRLALGQSVIVDNRPGAGGIVAMTTLKNSAPDGYTLAMVTNAHVVWNPYLFSKLPYDPAVDLVPVSPVATIPMVLTVSPALGANSLDDVVAAAKAKPGQLNYASSSNGSPPHVLFEMLKTQSGTDIVHVPFKSGPDALNSTLSDRTQLYLAGSALVEPQVKAGKLKAVAVGAANRLPTMPDVPTLTEKGYPGYEGVVWLGVVTNAGVPPAIVDRLNQEIGKVLQDPDMRKIYDAHGSDLYYLSAGDFAKRIQDDRTTWGPVIQKANIRLD